MKLAALFSGGKDSTYAIYKAMKKHDVVCLITIKSENPDSYMFHTPNINLTELQAESIGLPLLTAITKGQKEKELVDLKNVIEKAKELFKIEGVVTGALKSEYQASRVQKICDDLELKCINPLWQMNQEQEIKELIENNFKIMIIAVAAEGLNKEWLGRVIDKDALEELKKLKEKYLINVAGEGGEYESLVLNCPIFSKELVITKAKKVVEKNSGRYLIHNAELKH